MRRGSPSPEAEPADAAVEAPAARAAADMPGQPSSRRDDGPNEQPIGRLARLRRSTGALSPRSRAGMTALPLALLLWAAAAFWPIPYVTYEPGLTVDVLAEREGREIIQVTGHRAYRDDGELLMTTVYVSKPDSIVSLLAAVAAWLNPDDAVYPRSAVYREGETSEQSELESAVSMVSSQDVATAVALTELGYDVNPVVEVLNVSEGLPADGRLEVRDVLREVGGRRIDDSLDVVEAVDAAPVGEPLSFTVERGGERRTVEVTPRIVDGDKRVGIVPGPGFTFPFTVQVEISPTIGGPSAGLMFSLAIYDTLTEGSLTQGRVVAGTGTLDAAGNVGPIGGIVQKVIAARDAGAELFLVPAANCPEALAAARGDLRLVRADTMHQARRSVETWVADSDAQLPACTTGAQP